jgi:hypothetical protein
MNPLRSTRAHQLHFDASAFGPNGNRIRVRGVPAKLSPEDAERALELLQTAHNAERELRELLAQKGHESPQAQAHVIRRILDGWRPRKRNVSRESIPRAEHSA